MYKITLWDNNLDSCISGVTEFFIEDLEIFEKYRIGNEYEETRERYFKSKNGECITDYYSDSPELNIVQYDANCEFLATKMFEFKDKYITLRNFYDWETEIFASEVFVELAHIKHNGQYFLIGKYKLSGVCAKSIFDNEFYKNCTVYGNPVCIETFSLEELRQKEKCEKMLEEFEKCNNGREQDEIIEKLQKSREENMKKDPKDFVGHDLETYCYVTLGKFEKLEYFSMEDIKEMTEELFVVLMRDIPGSCG